MYFRSSPAWFKAALVMILLGCLAFIGAKVPGVDHLPLVWALHAELTGDSAYGPHLDVLFNETYSTICPPCATGGFAYPLPAIWLALPVAWLPANLTGVVWCIMSTGILLCGLTLLRMPPQMALFAPVWFGILQQQSTVLVVGLLLLGIWAAREQRWWLLGVIIALTGLTKPQTSILFACLFAIQLIQHRRWLPLLLPSAALLVSTSAIEPAWPLEWIKAAQRYNQALEPRWFIQWTALALLPLICRRRWTTLTIVQTCLFPVVANGYTLLPLLVAYVDIERRWLTWIVVIASWTLLISRSLVSNSALLAWGYFLPFTVVMMIELLTLRHKQFSKPSPVADVSLHA
ncbi:MAG TPA: glycosyltransferase 87 family protein [Roseiflexaceae bacterium]|nr:glycosyltransferase 87 family protein [Roseiflexaceae bacterium]